MKIGYVTEKFFFNGKNIQNRYFRFKIRFEPFLIDSDEKMKNFEFSSRFLAKESIYWAKNFENFVHPFHKDCIAVILHCCTVPRG